MGNFAISFTSTKKEENLSFENAEKAKEEKLFSSHECIILYIHKPSERKNDN